MDYFEGNNQLALDALMMLDLVKVNRQKQLTANMTNIDNAATMMMLITLVLTLPHLQQVC